MYYSNRSGRHSLIHLAVYGSGLGHAARMLPLVRLLSDSFDVYCTSWGEGLKLLRRNGLDCVEIPPVDVQWGSEGRMAFKKTVRTLPKFYGSFGLQILREMELMERMRPDLVISDSRLSAVASAYFSGIPSILVTNQIRVNLPPLRSRMMRFLERVNGESLAAFWNAADATIVPDLPPPYTISEYSLDTLRLPRNRYLYVGFFYKNGFGSLPEPTSPSSSPTRPAKERKKIFFMISGPAASRVSLLPRVVRSAKILSENFDVVVSKGDPAGSSEPTRDGGVTIFDWCPDEEVGKQMRTCDIVVSRAGHETISKVILAGKPAVLIPIPFHGEQWGNAQKCEKLGFAKMVDQYSLTSETLASEVKSCLQDGAFAENAIRLRDVALKMDGLLNATSIVKIFANGRSVGA